VRKERKNNGTIDIEYRLGKKILYIYIKVPDLSFKVYIYLGDDDVPRQSLGAHNNKSRRDALTPISTQAPTFTYNFFFPPLIIIIIIVPVSTALIENE